MTQDRRHFLQIALTAPIIALASGRALAQGAVCYDPEDLPLPQQNVRKSVQFQEVSNIPAKRCELCAFFTPSQGGCGSCQILNGPTTARSLCSSFAAKAK
jgi:hypothetical protein